MIDADGLAPDQYYVISEVSYCNCDAYLIDGHRRTFIWIIVSDKVILPHF